MPRRTVIARCDDLQTARTISRALSTFEPRLRTSLVSARTLSAHVSDLELALGLIRGAVIGGLLLGLLTLLGATIDASTPIATATELALAIALIGGPLLAGLVWYVVGRQRWSDLRLSWRNVPSRT